MGRGKIEIKKIENINSRQVTFSKRRSGLVKKATELSVLCDCDVGLVIISSTNKLYEYSSKRMDIILQKYEEMKAKATPATSHPPHELPSIEHVVESNPTPEVTTLREELAKQRNLYLRMQGKGLEGMSYKELQQLEQQLNEGLLSVREKKEHLAMEQLEKARLKEEKIAMENEELRKELEELKRSMKSTSSGSSSMKRKRDDGPTDEGCIMEKEVDSDPRQNFLNLGLQLATTNCMVDMALAVVPKTETISDGSNGQMTS